jgi:hypothetical protein
MSIKKPLALKRILCLYIVLLFISTFQVSLFAQDAQIENILPMPGFLKGWAIEGKVTRYGKDNLYIHINGEAELYMPYGFKVLETALYAKESNRNSAIVADVYQMGSLIDAFGIYSYYRSPDGEVIKIGSEGFIDQSQLMFYKDSYFMRLSASGTIDPNRAEFLACAEEIAKKIPGESSRPKEVEMLSVPGIMPRTEKYIAQSVLGYAFFRRGLTASATIDGESVKVFFVFNESVKHAQDTLDLYITYLKEAGMQLQSNKNASGTTLIANDPLYKGVMVRQSGRYLFGVVNLKDPARGTTLVELFQSRITIQ